MKIINNTKWRTDHLRAFVTRVAKEELEPSKRKKVVIQFNHTHTSRWCTRGEAWIGGTHAQIWMPSPANAAKFRGLHISLAGILAHEMAHLRGLTGERDMRASARYGRGKGRSQFYAWAIYMRLEEKPARAKASQAEKAQAKALRIESNIKSWEGKKRRADNALRKYRKQLKYYNKRLAAMNMEPTDPAVSVPGA